MKKVRFCPECGTRVEEEDNFCPRCRYSLKDASQEIRKDIRDMEPDLAIAEVKGKKGTAQEQKEQKLPKKFSAKGCPNCGSVSYELMDNVYFCKTCYAEYVRCPKCRMFVDKLNDACQNCGHSLVYGKESYTDNALSFFKKQDLKEYYTHNPFKFFFLFLLAVVAAQYLLTREYAKGGLTLVIFLVWRFKWTKRKALDFSSRLIFFFIYLIKVFITLAILVIMYMM